MTMILSGQDLIDAGMAQGRWFRDALVAANAVLARGGSVEAAMDAARALAPPPALGLHAPGAVPLHVNLLAETAEEQANLAAVTQSMTLLLRTPMLRAGAVLPDACPSGPPGTIPVGGVAVSDAIHPGLHSADICCSVAISVLPGADPAALLDAVQAVTHFGPGGRPRGQQIRPDPAILALFEANDLLRDGTSAAIEQFATQGDGNHFAFVGRLASSGQTALVTHHGSRGPGARLYTRGMKIAEAVCRAASPETLAENAWIPADTPQGDQYWAALQAIRAWTRGNHWAIHDMAAGRVGAKVADRFWNEHNFVFRRSDGRFYHGKGATPAFAGWAADATDLTLIPLNMAEPVLIVRGRDTGHGLGFSPHGAGRNTSRSRHKQRLAGRSDAEIFADETRGIDARFFCGITDISELPSAYKSAAEVRRQIAHFGLAEVVDEVIPHGSIMAGDWQANAPWRRKKAAAAR